MVERKWQQKVYQEKVAVRLVSMLKAVIRSILLQFFDKIRNLQTALNQALGQVKGLSKWFEWAEAELVLLCKVEKDYNRLRRGSGEDEADRIINSVKTLKKQSNRGSGGCRLSPPFTTLRKHAIIIANSKFMIYFLPSYPSEGRHQ